MMPPFYYPTKGNIMYNYELDTSLLPKVWLTWASTKNRLFNKRYWLNCQTGEKKDTPEDWMYYENESKLNAWNCPEGKVRYGHNRYGIEKIWTYSGAHLIYFYAKYHEDIEKLELAAVTMNTTRKEETKPWTWAGKRYFLGKDKSAVDVDGKPVENRYELYEYHNAWSVKTLISGLARLAYTPNIIAEIKKFIGGDNFPIGNGTLVEITGPWHLQRWFETSQKTRGKGKEQKLTDKLTAITLKDFSDFSTKYPITEVPSRWGTTHIKDIVYFERVDDEWSVLRSFHRNPDNTLTETWRMYIGDGGANRIVTPSPSGWIPATQQTFGWRVSNSRIVNKTEASEQCNRCKYVLSALTGVSALEEVHAIVTALRFPEVEQLIKLGYQKEALSLISTNQIKANIKHAFGGTYNEKEKNLLKKVGLTKKQFDVFMEHRRDGRYGWSSASTLKTLRETYGDKLIHMDSDTFDRLLTGYSNILYHWSQMNLDSVCTSHNLDREKFINNMIRLGSKNDSDYRLIWDTYSMNSRLTEGTAPTINWYFDDHSDIIRAHDAVMAIYNMQEAERRALYNLKEAERRKEEDKKREKIDAERKKYEFEDDNYIIRLPKNVLEIITEGSTQHICIGGYTSRHSLGQTNLFFLRKKSAPDTPFYAIEMDNHKNIVQIHGFGNRWLGNNPEAIPTVIRWLRKHDIKCHSTILTCTSTGYCGRSNYVDMPVVDGKKGI